MYSGELEWIFAENGQDADNLAMYKAFNCERKKIIDTNRNWGINCAFNDMHRISRGEFVVEMENDWWATDIEFDWITRSLDIMRNDPDIGIVQLRSIWDSNENWGIHKKDYNIWSVGGYSEAKTESGHSYLYAKDFYAYNHNPNLSRKVAIESILPLSEPIYQSDLRNGEGEAQKIFRETHWKCAHINRRLFEHVGGSLRKQFER
jgi:GT2 family glycosyltransferase